MSKALLIGFMAVAAMAMSESVNGLVKAGFEKVTSNLTIAVNTNCTDAQGKPCQVK